MTMTIPLPTPHMSDHVHKLIQQRHRKELEDHPRRHTKVCIGPSMSHFVRSDNPMCTGRCENCRRFVALTRDGWTACTIRQAAVWGCLGTRRLTRSD